MSTVPFGKHKHDGVDQMFHEILVAQSLYRIKVNVSIRW